MSKAVGKAAIPIEGVIPKIMLVRSQKVLLDADLATLYGVTTSNLNKAVKRNLKRFPEDFMFQINAREAETLRFHFGISKGARGGRRYLPYAFTEQGVAMLSSVLNSERAVQVNIAIMQAFVKLREVLATNQDLAHKFDALEKRVGHQDGQIKHILDAIREMLVPGKLPTRREIGFHVKDEYRDGKAPQTRRRMRSKS